MKEHIAAILGSRLQHFMVELLRIDPQWVQRKLKGGLDGVEGVSFSENRAVSVSRLMAAVLI